MRVVFLKGDYTGRHKNRQLQAKLKGTDFVISFHFNYSNNPKAEGAEVYYNIRGGEALRQIAQDVLNGLCSAFNFKNRGIKEASNSRASFLNFYECPAILLEPCFVSNPNEAKLLHDVDTIRKMGEVICDAILKHIPKGCVIGIDIGHKFKDTHPYDKGAKCVLGDWEADHAEKLAKVVASILMKVK